MKEKKEAYRYKANITHLYNVNKQAYASRVTLLPFLDYLSVSLHILLENKNPEILKNDDIA